MNTAEEILNRANKIIPINKTSSIVLALLMLIILWGGVRSCSQNPKWDRSKTFVIARDPSWYPLNLMGKEKNVLAFTNDLLLSIAKERGVRLELISVTANSLFEGLEFNQYNGIISSILPNPMNNQIYNFSDPFFFTGPVLIVPIDSKITSFEQMSDKVVGIPENPNITFNIGKYKTFYKPFSSITEAFHALYLDQVDGILLPAMQAYAYIDTFHKGAFRVITTPLSDQGLRLVTKQTEQSQYVIEEFNAGLQKMFKDGTYSVLCKKWGLIDPFAKDTNNKLDDSDKKNDRINN